MTRSTTRTSSRRAFPGLAILIVGLLAACGDQGPESGPGDLTVSVVSPNGVEGAALIRLVGEGMGAVSPASGRLFHEGRGDTLTVVLVNVAGGDLGFTVAVADTTRHPQAVLVEVSGPDDEIRPLTGYSVEVRR